MFQIIAQGQTRGNTCDRYISTVVPGDFEFSSYPTSMHLVFDMCGKTARYKFLYVAMVPNPTKKGRSEMRKMELMLYRCIEHLPEKVVLG